MWHFETGDSWNLCEYMLIIKKAKRLISNILLFSLRISVLGKDAQSHVTRTKSVITHILSTENSVIRNLINYRRIADTPVEKFFNVEKK